MLEVLDGVEAVQKCRADIEALKTEGSLVAGCNLAGYERYDGH